MKKDVNYYSEEAINRRQNRTIVIGLCACLCLVAAIIVAWFAPVAVQTVKVNAVMGAIGDFVVEEELEDFWGISVDGTLSLKELYNRLSPADKARVDKMIDDYVTAENISAIKNLASSSQGLTSDAFYDYVMAHILSKEDREFVDYLVRTYCY